MKKPDISEQAYIAPGAVVRGNVIIEKDCSIWFHATIRAESAPITIGTGSNIQDNAVIHVDEDFPVKIGAYVTVGHGAIIHGCSIGSQTLIGMGAVILNGAVIGSGCIIGAAALIPQNAVIPDGSLVLGVPGRIIRPTTNADIAHAMENAQKYIRESRLYAQE